MKPTAEWGQWIARDYGGWKSSIDPDMHKAAEQLIGHPLFELWARNIEPHREVYEIVVNKEAIGTVRRYKSERLSAPDAV